MASKRCPITFVLKTMELARQMTIVADEGDNVAMDDGCAVLCAVVRDCAYAIRARADQEKLRFQALGTWPTSTEETTQP